MKKHIQLFLVLIIIEYLIGAFISLDFNPFNWLIIKHELGRILILLIVFLNIYWVIELSD